MLSRQRPDDRSAFGPDVLRVLAGRPWVVAAADALLGHPDLVGAHLVVAAPPGVFGEVRDALAGTATDRPRASAAGPLLVESGPTVHASLHAVLDATSGWAGTTRCVVHDVCRPLVSPDLVATVLTAARAAPHAPVVPTLPLVETVKVVDADGRIVRTLDRGVLVRVQTPQAGPLAALRAAHRHCTAPFGERPNLVGDASTTTVVPGEDRADLMASGHDGDQLAAAWRS